MFMIVLIKEQQAARARSSQPIINFETFFVLPTDDRVTDRQNELPTDNDNNYNDYNDDNDNVSNEQTQQNGKSKAIVNV